MLAAWRRPAHEPLIFTKGLKAAQIFTTKKMNLNVWNIKDMFSIPPGMGTSKSSSRNSAPSDHSSLTDSQFLFGSQFCPDNSQPAALDFGAQSKQQKSSEHNSQDSESSIFIKYQTRPHLFGGDGKEKGSFQSYNTGKPKGFLEQFEENRKKAKDKQESEILSSLICHIQEGIQRLHTSFSQFEENENSRSKSVLDGLENVSKTFQENAHSYYGLILNAVTTKSSMEQALLEMESRLISKDTEFVELKSSLQNLRECLETLKAQQSEQYLKLSEQLAWLSDHLLHPDILTELQKLTSAPKFSINVKDSTSQTSPSWIEDLCLVHQEKAHSKNIKACRTVSSQTQPFATPYILSTDSNGHSLFENQVSEDMTYKSTLASTAEMDPTIGFLLNKGNVTLNKTEKIPHIDNLNSQVCTNHPPSDYDSSVKLSQSGPDIGQQVTQEVFHSRPTVMASKKEKKIKHAHPVQQNQIQQYPCITNTLRSSDEQTDTENTNEIAKLKNKHTNKRSKKSCRNKKAVRKKRAYASKKKKNEKKIKSSFDKSQTEFYEQASSILDSSQRDIFVLNSETCDSASAVNQNLLCTFQANNGEPSLPLLSSIHKIAVKRKEILGNKDANISKIRRKFSQWDCSSQESSLFHYNIKSEHQMTWFSPLNSVMNNSSCPTVKKGDQNIRFYPFLFDSSDDSD
uniref:Interactor of HORMAD1 protein 1 isoform X2 n=1 Tax=Geotrypetes seraphini TaxID=260995 RepID=A0A6P8P198_GEOSA|nr:interactor of HORMAD1 protein 1 isoform X2 [Geotrypetes seraphini]